jgi:hypothetical protein
MNFKIFRDWFLHPRSQFDRAISGPARIQIYTLLVFFILLFMSWIGISYLIFSGAKTDINRDIDNRFWSILAQMIDPGNMHMVGRAGESVPWGLRLFVFLVTFSGTIAFGGILISTISNIFERRIDNIKDGLVNYRFRNHLVIIGFDFVVIGLIKQLLRTEEYKGCKVVVHTGQNAQSVRQKLMAQLVSTDEKRVVLLHGGRDSEEEMERLDLHLARKIFILGEPEESDHDSRNIECLKIISSLLTYKKAGIKDCHVMFEYQTTYAIFQFMDIGLEKISTINLLPLNYYENWAQKIFITGKYVHSGRKGKIINYKPLDYKHIAEDSALSVHLVIAGITKMGIALALEAARLAHFANNERVKSRITFIDTIADEEENFFASRYPAFYKAVNVYRENIATGEISNKPGTLPFIDIELEFITGNIETAAVREKLVEWASDDRKLLTLAVCFNHSSASLAAGLYLPDELYEKNIPVLVQQDLSYSILSLIPGDDVAAKKFSNVKPFGMTDDSLDLDLNNDKVAKAINYFYSGNMVFEDSTFPLKNDIEEKWKRLPERDKWSNRYCAGSIPVKLRAVEMSWGELMANAVSFTGKQIELISKMEHARWNTERLLAGFSPATEQDWNESLRTANLAEEALEKAGGNEKDETYINLKKKHEEFVRPLKKRLIHPCITPYDQLSIYYKKIDRKLAKAIPYLIRI